MKYQGMTLLEVMVALLIFALTATTVMKAASEHLRSIGMLEELTFATWVANNRMNQIMIETTWPPKHNLKGSDEMANGTWYWQQLVTETQEKDMRSIEITVSTDQEGNNIVTSVTSFVSKPTQGKKGDS